MLLLLSRRVGSAGASLYPAVEGSDGVLAPLSLVRLVARLVPGAALLASGIGLLVDLLLGRVAAFLVDLLLAALPFRVGHRSSLRWQSARFRAVTRGNLGTLTSWSRCSIRGDARSAR